MLLHIGFDDTDHYKGGCTTYICSLIVEKLSKKVTFVDYPHLIRLNPNIPFKTRGNAAVSIKILCEDPEDVVDLVWNTIMDNYSGLGKAEPALVAIKETIPSIVKIISMRALHEVLSLDYVKRVIAKNNIQCRYIGRGRGLVGALAAVGFYEADFSDYTFELLAYRERSMWGKVRKMEYESLLKVDRAFRPYIYANIDYRKKRPLVLSHGPDPVLFGIRGDFPQLLVEAMKEIKVEEKIDRWLIFKTNQCTEIHLFMRKTISQVRPYDSVTISGVVVSEPVVIKGGHVVIEVSDGTGSIDCIFYRKTRLNVLVLKLRKHDYVELSGGVKVRKGKLTLNVEKIQRIELAEVLTRVPPLCPFCREKMKSKGRAVGYKCPRCKYIVKQSSFKEILREQLIPFKQAPAAYRHLTKPKEREGLEYFEKQCELIEEWHYP